MSYSFYEAESLLKEDPVQYGNSNNILSFLVDAQLPKKLSDFLNSKGHSSLHTLDLPGKNATTDKYIKEKACPENLILITKDDDFLRSFLIERKPPKLLLIKTGNISNSALMTIFDKGFKVIISLISRHSMIEINKEEIIVHD
jgi:predicted nuclease of predicted toxin-antitoxin system